MGSVGSFEPTPDATAAANKAAADPDATASADRAGADPDATAAVDRVDKPGADPIATAAVNRAEANPNDTAAVNRAGADPNTTAGADSALADRAAAVNRAAADPESDRAAADPESDRAAADPESDRAAADRLARQAAASLLLTRPLQFELLESAIDHWSLVPHMIHSYNCFVTEMLPRILEEHSRIVTRGRTVPVEHCITIMPMGTTIEPPAVREHTGRVRRITHTEAKLRGFNYASCVSVDVEHTETPLGPDGQAFGPPTSTKTWHAVALCLIPTMVGSVICSSNHGLGVDLECPMDIGGYFVFNGNDKCILSQEKLKTNTIFVFPGKNGSKMAFTCEIRSCHEAKMRSTSTLYIQCSRSSRACIPVLSVSVPFIHMTIPITHMFVLLGCETLEGMLDCVVGELRVGGGVVSPNVAAMAVAMMENSFDGVSVAAVLATVAKGCTRHKTAEARARYMEHIVTHEVLPHVGIEATELVLSRKRMFLGLMVRRTAAVMAGEAAPDDRDTYANKRIDTPGMLLSLLFRQLMRKTVKNMSLQVLRAIENNKAVVVPDIFENARITSGFRYAFGSGNWGTQNKGPATQSGVVQTLTSCNIVSSWANLRRINTPINREGKAPKPRQLHTSSWRRVCCCETPEGGSCGLVKNMAMLCHTRMLCPMEVLADVVDRYVGGRLTALDAATARTLGEQVPLFINGNVHAFVRPEDVDSTVATMRTARRHAAMPFDVSVYVRGLSGVHIDSDAGALLSPVLDLAELPRLAGLVRDLASTSPSDRWARLVYAGVVVYLDNSEEEGYLVASTTANLRDTTVLYTHLEIHPTLINGLCASIIPFSNHNQAPRNVYQCLDPTTPVLMADLTIRAIGDVRVGDAIVTVDPVTHLRAVTLVVEQFVRRATKPTVRLTTAEGHQLICTVDHPLLTSRGWVPAAHARDIVVVPCRLGLESRPTPIVDRRPVDCPMVADISTQSSNHSFVVVVGRTGLVVHNSAMCKQAVAVYAGNHRTRMDVAAHVLDYAAPPLVTTWIDRILGTPQLPSGTTIIVAIMCYSGFNQEDSLIANQASIDRGMFRSTLYRTYREEERTNGSEIERFERPDTSKCLVLKAADYSTVNEDGMVEPGQLLREGDCIVGKTMLMTEVCDEGKRSVKRDRSLFMNNSEPERVDAVLRAMTVDGQRHGYCKVKTRATRTPHVGDKFSCYTPDHQLLTRRGWVGVAEVGLDDVVATLDPETGCVSYEIVEAVHVYPVVDEPMCAVGGRVSLWTTTNHNMYVKMRGAADFELVRADNLDEPARFLKSCRHGLQASQCIAPVCPVPTHDVDALFFFLGFWMGRGWADTFSGDKKAERITVCPGGWGSARILAATRACGLTPVVNGHRFHVYHKPLFDTLVPLSVDRPRRRLPEGWFDLPRTWSRCVLDGLLDAAGEAGSEYTFLSSEMCDDVQRLALHCGWSADALGQTRSAKWRVRINRWQNMPLLGPAGQSTVWTGNVHCVTVRTGIVYVRRNGLTVWCGNSRHGQKGVIGLVLPAEDMPFTSEGIQPDIIVNPQALPSRMTLGHLVECLAGKVAAHEGRTADGTPFHDVTVDGLGDALAELGLERHGNERMTMGTTGEILEGDVFIGPTFYQRLKHMVDDKVHARSRGPKKILTRGPVDGRKSHGGLRVGEMERDSLLANGVSAMLQDRLMEQSDAYVAPVCTKCGMLAEHDCTSQALVHRARKAYCRNCDGNDVVSHVMPYAFKLLLQEVQVMGISARLHFEEEEAEAVLSAQI
jgi:DNA-directed RNA polymerase beta subunit